MKKIVSTSILIFVLLASFGQVNRYYKPAEYTPTNTYVTPDYGTLMNLLQMKQAQYDQNQKEEKAKAVALMEQVKAYYNSLTSFPLTIKNGWHKVTAMDNYEFCEERKVYVENNKVTKYVIDNWIEKSVSYPTTINKGKALIQLKEADGSTGSTLDVYFLEYINNPNSSTSAPIKPGRVSFWTNWKNSGSMKVYFEGVFIGTFKSYFPDSSPTCGQDGTITISFKPGTYNYSAISEGDWTTKTWEGTITITEGGCTLQGLVK
jgi:hypothetical protein